MASIAQMIADTASRYGVAPALALEVATVESNLNPAAVSPAGAIGVFQLMPATAASLGVDPRNPSQNIDGGVRYLRQMLNQFGDLVEALAAYDWGPGAVSNAIAAYGAQWLAHAPAETQNYVQTIVSNLGTQYTVSQAPAAPAEMPVPDTTDSTATDGTAAADGTVIDPSLLADMTGVNTPSLTTILLFAALGLVALYLVER